MPKSSSLKDVAVPRRQFVSEITELRVGGKIGLPRPLLAAKGWLKDREAPRLVAETLRGGWVRIWRLETIQHRIAAMHEELQDEVEGENLGSSLALAVFEERYREVTLYLEKECRLRIPKSVEQVLLFLDPSNIGLIARIHSDFIDLVSAPLRMMQLEEFSADVAAESRGIGNGTTRPV